MGAKPENSGYFGSGQTWMIPRADPIESPQRSSASGTQYYTINDERTIEKRSYQVGSVTAGDTNDDSRYAEWQHVNGAVVPTRTQIGVPSELFSAYNITLDADRASSAATNHALQLGATDLEYEVTRVKSPVIGRDMNPMGRGDGTYYAQGMSAVRGAKPRYVGCHYSSGIGNSVNNLAGGDCEDVGMGDKGSCCCGWIECWTCMMLVGPPAGKPGCTSEICDWGLQKLYKTWMQHCCDCLAACCLEDGGWPECGFIAGCGYSSADMDEAPCGGGEGEDEDGNGGGKCCCLQGMSKRTLVESGECWCVYPAYSPTMPDNKWWRRYYLYVKYPNVKRCRCSKPDAKLPGEFVASYDVEVELYGAPGGLYGLWDCGYEPGGEENLPQFKFKYPYTCPPEGEPLPNPKNWRMHGKENMQPPKIVCNWPPLPPHVPDSPK